MRLTDTKAIKQRYDLRDLAAQYTALKRKTAAELAGPCPKCGGTDRFYVTREFFACRGCHEKRGDVIEFMTWLDDLTFREACERLGSEEAPIRTEKRAISEPQAKQAAPPSEAWQDKTMAAVVRCQEELWSGREKARRALEYLRKERGLSDDTILDAMLGYNPDRGDVCGVWVENGFAIPNWHKAANTLWGVNVKRTGKKNPDPKYRAVKGSNQSALYLADNLIGRDVAVICEGELDALLLAQEAGDLAAVCTFGGAGVHTIEPWLPYLVHVKRLLIATDNDQAGADAWAFWENKTRRARRLAPPGGVKDLTDAWRTGADLRAWLAAGLTEKCG